jgi:hypothetical protein
MMIRHILSSTREREREMNYLLSLIIIRELTLKSHILCCLSVSQPSSSFLPFCAYQFRTVSLLIDNLCLSGLTLESRPLASRIAIWQGRAYHAGRFSFVLTITHSVDKVLFFFFLQALVASTIDLSRGRARSLSALLPTFSHLYLSPYLATFRPVTPLIS